MSTDNNKSLNDNCTQNEDEVFPVEPHYHPVHKFTRLIYGFFASAKLAIALLIIILLCCLAGVTVWRGTESLQFIFKTLWFNALLVLLVINVACCFFGRIWGRRVTVISFGMILFHLSFVVMLLAVVYNSLFYFRGIMRITEGEVLANSDPLNYEDNFDKGRYFSYSRLSWETSLVKMHTEYTVDGENKRAAYQIEIRDNGNKTDGIVYITHKFTYKGVDYFNEKEGYSLLMLLADKSGKELYGAHIPLQSYKQGDGFDYFTGYRENGVLKKDVIPFPSIPEKPLFALRTDYMPSKLQERGGSLQYLLFPLDKDGLPQRDTVLAKGNAAIGEQFTAGDYRLTAKEVRYWVGMLVRYEPGKPVVLTSLWAALAGMIITTIGRMLKRKVK